MIKQLFQNIDSCEQLIVSLQNDTTTPQEFGSIQQKITKLYAAIHRIMWYDVVGEDKNIAQATLLHHLKVFRTELGRNKPEFANLNQQDAFPLYMALIDMLTEDTNKVFAGRLSRTKPTIELDDATSSANDALLYEIGLYNSPIHDAFLHINATRTTCDNHHESVSFRVETCVNINLPQQDESVDIVDCITGYGNIWANNRIEDYLCHGCAADTMNANT